jgi:hypothetical protein
MSGSDLRAFGISDDPQLVADGWYLDEYASIVVWPIDATGLIDGERVYFGEKHRIGRRLGPGELPHLGPVERATG